MANCKQQKGFTLVELAIVMVIIGLLIGGILKGQELMTNARVSATLAQMRAIGAASTAFYDRYGAWPGDEDGMDKIPGCTTVCDIPDATARNGIIGATNWPMTAPQYTGGILGGGVQYEPGLFWYYLSASGMISGMTATAPSANPPVFGQDLPKTPFGGGMLVGNSDGTQIGSRMPLSAIVTITGTVLSLVVSPTVANDIANPGNLLLKPVIAGMIDAKIDDGLPGDGFVQAFGYAACVDNSSGESLYYKSNPSKDCGLYARVEGI